MRLQFLAVTVLLAATSFADTITMKSGRVMNGTYLGGTARTVRLDTGERVESLDTSDIARIEFSGPPQASSQDDRPQRSDNDRPVLRRSDDDGANGVVLRPDPNAASAPPPVSPAGPIDLAAGTNIVVRMIDGVDSDVARVGQTFNASLDEPVVNQNGETLIPRGADAVVKLVDSKESGRLTGRAELTLDLMSVKVNGRMVDVNTQTVSRASDARGKETAKKAGGVAAVGAIIGAVAGGGKGAAIGAAAGGAAGAGVEAVTKGQRVKVPSETRLTFVLDTPVRM